MDAGTTLSVFRVGVSLQMSYRAVCSITHMLRMQRSVGGSRMNFKSLATSALVALAVVVAYKAYEQRTGR